MLTINSLTGIQISLKFSYKGTMGRWRTPYGEKVAQRAKRMGMKIEMNDVWERHIIRIAKRYHANRYDFVRSAWDVRKI